MVISDPVQTVLWWRNRVESRVLVRRSATASSLRNGFKFCRSSLARDESSTPAIYDIEAHLLYAVIYDTEAHLSYAVIHDTEAHLPHAVIYDTEAHLPYAVIYCHAMYDDSIRI